MSDFQGFQTTTGQHLELFGPFWQFECTRCREMSDVFDSLEERDDIAAEHDCGATKMFNDVIFSLRAAGVDHLDHDMTDVDLAWQLVNDLGRKR